MKTYTCFIEGNGDLWEALCVDFDIAVTATSLPEIMSLIQEAVHVYVEEASLEADPDRTRLLNRRSPWQVRLKWKLRLAVAGFRSEKPDTTSPQGSGIHLAPAKLQFC